MRFTQLLGIAASTLLVRVTAEPALSSDALEGFSHLNEPEAYAAFHDVLNGNIPSQTRRSLDFEERCCGGVCCNPDTCTEDGNTCVESCSAYSSPYQQLGCVAGCAVACP